MASRGRPRAGIHAAVAAVAVTAGLGVASAAGADGAANADIYARDSCFSVDAAATQCAAGETADVTIASGEKVTFHFEGDQPHNAIGSSWKVPNTPDPPPQYATKGDTYEVTFTQAGVYDFLCSVHPGMTGRITVQGAAATQTPSPPPTASPQPGGGVTPPPAATDDAVKPTLRGVRAKALRRAVRVRFRLSEPATVTVRVKRRGSRRVVKSARVQLRAGTRRVTLRKLKRGRYTIEIRARDPYGNVSRVARKRLKL
jgi:plastocyanin